MPSTETKIIEILKDYYSEKPLRREDLLNRLRDFGIAINDGELRRIFAAMIVDGHKPLGSSVRGYFYIHNEKDLEEAETELEQKAKAISVRRECLIRNFREVKNISNSLFDMNAVGLRGFR